MSKLICFFYVAANMIFNVGIHMILNVGIYMTTNFASCMTTNVARGDECALRNFPMSHLSRIKYFVRVSGYPRISQISHFFEYHGFFQCLEPPRYPRNFHMSRLSQTTWFFRMSGYPRIFPGKHF